MAKKKNTNGFEQLTGELKTRAKKLQKRAGGELKSLEKRAKQLERKAKKTEIYVSAKKLVNDKKLVDSKKLRRNVNGQLDDLHHQLLDLLGLASRNDLDKLNKKLNSLNRKVNGLSRAA